MKLKEKRKLQSQGKKTRENKYIASPEKEAEPRIKKSRSLKEQKIPGNVKGNKEESCSHKEIKEP